MVEQLAADLRAEFPGVGGFSVSNLWQMKAFFEAYTGLEKLSHQWCEKSAGAITWQFWSPARTPAVTGGHRPSAGGPVNRTDTSEKGPEPIIATPARSRQAPFRATRRTAPDRPRLSRLQLPPSAPRLPYR